MKVNKGMQNNQIEKLHMSLLKILDEIDRICRENNISYFLDSGTALGAIRHKGFIPWDDDADVGMLREDYERFIKVAKDQLKPEFFLQTRETEPEYINFNAKIRLNNTFFPEAYNKNAKVHKGIFVDVFPFDYISDNRRKAVLDTKVSRLLVAGFLFRVRRPEDESSLKKIIRSCYRLIPERCLESICYRFYTKHSKKKTNTLTCYSYRMNSNHILHFPAEVFQTMDTQFEDRIYSIMSGYDTYLKIMFGDYMKLPPEDKRVCHIDGEIRFE